MGLFSFLSALKPSGPTKTNLFREQLVSFIASYETFKPKAYLPTPNDVWTIGYGRTQGVKQGDVTSEAAERLDLEKRVSTLFNAIQKRIPSHLATNIHHINAMVSLADNVGLGALFRSNSFKKYLAGDVNGFANGAFHPTKGFVRQAGKILNGLVARRRDEKAIFEKGVYKRT